MTPIEIAEAQLGVTEATGQNDGPEVEGYLLGPWSAKMHGDRLPWCAAFVLWCFEQAGHKFGAERWALRSVSAFEDATARAGCWFGPHVEGAPSRGDVFFLAGRGDSDAGSGRHMGFISGVVQGFGYQTIEGNVGDSVVRASRSPAGITGFARLRIRGRFLA